MRLELGETGEVECLRETEVDRGEGLGGAFGGAEGVSLDTARMSHRALRDADAEVDAKRVKERRMRMKTG